MGVVLAGFTDYSSCFPIPSIAWIAVGAIVPVGAICSILPQVVRLVVRRSNRGVNPGYAFTTSLGQFVGVVNVVCLQVLDFVGIVQMPSFLGIFPRFMTFLGNMALWYCYLPVSFMCWQFSERGGKIEMSFGVAMPVLVVGFVAVWGAFGMAWGFDSSGCRAFARVIGVAGSVSVVAQYAPQFYTTCKVKSNAGLSLTFMAIQAPGGLVYALFQALGQRADWSTWLPTLASAVQMTTLLIIALVFRALRARRQVVPAAEASDAVSEQLFSADGALG